MAISTYEDLMLPKLQRVPVAHRPIFACLRIGNPKPCEAMLDEGVRSGQARGVAKLFDTMHRYKTAFLRGG